MGKDSSKLRKKLLSSERGTIRKKSFSLRVALGFPNSYEVGMSNLGYQTIYRLLNQMEGVVCERFFAKLFDEMLDFSTHRGAKTLESNLNLRSFDIIAFSVPFELDYLNVLKLLRISDIPLKSSQRGTGDPLIIAGGVAITLNSETMADFFDCLLIGEAEEALPDFIRTYFQSAKKRGSKEERLLNLSKIKGVYVPQFYDIIYDQKGKTKKREIKKGVFERIERRKADVSKIETFSPISSPYIHFKNSLLVEVGRGCARGCRFCAAGHIYRPCRFHDKESVLSQVENHIGENLHVGLVGSLISDHPDLENICSDLHQRGLEIGVSSFRVDKISSNLMKILAKSGLKTLTVAPEVGSEKMWKVINKNISREDVLKSAKIAAEAGIDNLKLYFMIGLPFEEDQDIEGIIDLIHQIHDIYIKSPNSKYHRPDSIKGMNRMVHTKGGTHRKRRLILSINPFIPKPHTPFQWTAMNQEKELKAKIKRIETKVKNLKGVHLEKKSIRQAILQGILSVGNRRVGEGLFYHIQENLTFHQAWKKAGVDVDSIIFKQRDFGSSLPWDIIDSGINKSFLIKEFEKAKRVVEEF
ncbi:MAG: radical SAM protein [candidate division Zixibacteria bacterium]|nr:radical SAM protein [candidate division Zixibacteria bacterium]